MSFSDKELLVVAIAPGGEVWERLFLKNEMIPVYGLGGLAMGDVLMSQTQPAAP